MALKVIYKTGLQGPEGPQGPVGPPGSGGSVYADWLQADGFVKSVTHNLNTYDLSFSFVDLGSGEFFEVGDIISSSSNVTTFYSNEAPGPSGWRIIIRS